MSEEVGPAIDTYPPVDRVYYIDDSGIPKTGLALYSALGVSAVNAGDVLRAWRELRRSWYVTHAVPADFELHASAFLAGRGRPGGRNPLKIERYRMAQNALEVIGAQSDLTVTTVYAVHTAHWREAKRAAYTGLIRRLDRQLDEAGEYAALIVDGDGSEELYEDVHRQIRPARIKAPAAEVPAHTSEWLQMADLVAYSACQVIAQLESRAFMWGWYTRYLPKARAPERY
ncbi:DUF3800 domain-containing protein [Streptomyces sp. NPDC059743]|uniref:DUF3800 domain-containing protein n=1 Tax=Streptomyces sp. NPDC059743 TaxID=3346928 RepID=UPI00366097BF